MSLAFDDWPSFSLSCFGFYIIYQECKTSSLSKDHIWEAHSLVSWILVDVDTFIVSMKTGEVAM